MASIAGSYNPEAAPSEGFKPLPAGEYKLEIVESEYKATQGGSGMILACKARVVGGEFDLRPYYINYNLENDNEISQEIGQRNFAGLRRATGVLAPTDSAQLHFQTFRVKIGSKARKDTGELENVIVQYLFDDGVHLTPQRRSRTRPVPKSSLWRQ